MRLCWQALKRKAAVCVTDPFGIVREHLVGSLNYLSFVFGHGLSPRLFDAILDDELMNLRHMRIVADRGANRKCGLYLRKLLAKVLDSRY